MPTRRAYSLFLLFNVVKDRLVGGLFKSRLVTCLGIIFIARAETLGTEVEGVAEWLVDAG